MTKWQKEECQREKVTRSLPPQPREVAAWRACRLPRALNSNVI